MLESGFQSKIIKSIEDEGGVVVNGTYSKKGIADLICGYPIRYWDDGELVSSRRLLHLHVEVKTMKDYETLMKNNIKEVDGLYVVHEDFKGRERLQAFKLNEVRKKGGLALFAYCFEQVERYVDDNAL